MNNYTSHDIHPVMANVNSQWLRLIERTKRHKEETFSAGARECMTWFSGPKSWDDLMRNKYVASPVNEHDMGFKMHVNKAYEFVKIFGPALYFQNPVRTVKPRAPVQIPGQYFPNPQEFMMLAQMEQARVAIDGIRAILIEAYLNWTPSRYQLDVESRQAIDEALIKGRGLLWTELVESPDKAFRAVVSKFDSVDHLLIDPDASSFKDAKWIARRCIQPIWMVENDYGLRRGSLKGNFESVAAQADIAVDPDLQARRRQGLTSDLMVFHQIWSKMGIGGRISQMNPNLRTPLDEIFGDFCYLVVCDAANFPLNLHPDLVNDPERYDDTLRSAQWPIPFFADNKWPCSELDFNILPNNPWPMPPMMAAQGEMRFLNWVFSFLAGHLKNACRTFVGLKKALNEEVKTALESGSDLAFIELEGDHGKITEAVEFLKHPEVNGDIFDYIQMVQNAFDKRMGLNEVMYGGSLEQTQPRSAAESNIRSQSAGIRPDDMAVQAESWQTEVAAKEAFCARFLLGGNDVKICMGPLASMAWSQYVFTEQVSEAFHQLEYRIEAGSTRKPNKEFQVRQMTEMVEAWLETFVNYATQTGDLAPLNNLLADYCKSRDLDENRYQLKAAPVAPMLPSAAGGQPTSGGGLSVYPSSGQEQLG